MEGFNYKYYEIEATTAWIAFDGHHKDFNKALLLFADTIARSLACIADSLEKQNDMVGAKPVDFDAGIAEKCDEE